MEYRVSWVIEVNAESPVLAARQAKAIQLDAASIANVFEVRCVGGHPAYKFNVDLDQEK